MGKINCAGVLMYNILARIGVPQRTRIEAIFLVPDGWHVWTGVSDKKAPYSDWRGNYIHLLHDGSCINVNVHPDGSETLTRVKDKIS